MLTIRTEEALINHPAKVNEDPDFAEFAEVDLADARQRPEMHLQVVLDAQGFGPGVIDGGMGMSTVNALKSFQEAGDLSVNRRTRYRPRGRHCPAGTMSLPTRVVRIPESWGRLSFGGVPEDYADPGKARQPGL